MSWGKWTGSESQSSESMLSACEGNVERARMREEQARQLLGRLELGDPQAAELRYQVRVATAERAHWEEYAAYYRKAAAIERGHWSEQERARGEDAHDPF